jgi:choline dehydrogenase
LFIFGVPSRFTGYFPGYSDAVVKNYFTWVVLKAHTQNRGGKVTLRTTDPRDTPDINFHYFDEGTDASGQDLDSVINGVQFARTLTDSFRDMVAAEEAPGPEVQSREDLGEFVKNEAWGHHASCTCKIGAKNDPMAVLDGDFQVYGTNNLRVVDASVFPVIQGFFIVSSVYMISEKASDVILEAAKNRSGPLPAHA